MATVTEDFRWIKSRGVPTKVYLLILASAAILAALVVEWTEAFGLGRLISGLEGSAQPGGWEEALILYIAILFLPLWMVFYVLGSRPTRIGIGDRGIKVLTVFGSKEVEWQSLRPGMFPPTGQWDTWRSGAASRADAGVFWITREQARNVLLQPNAPVQQFPLEYWDWVGLPAPVGDR